MIKIWNRSSGSCNWFFPDPVGALFLSSPCSCAWRCRFNVCARYLILLLSCLSRKGCPCLQPPINLDCLVAPRGRLYLHIIMLRPCSFPTLAPSLPVLQSHPLYQLLHIDMWQILALTTALLSTLAPQIHVNAQAVLPSWVSQTFTFGWPGTSFTLMSSSSTTTT